MIWDSYSYGYHKLFNEAAVPIHAFYSKTFPWVLDENHLVMKLWSILEIISSSEDIS